MTRACRNQPDDDGAWYAQYGLSKAVLEKVYGTICRDSITLPNRYYVYKDKKLYRVHFPAKCKKERKIHSVPLDLSLASNARQPLMDAREYLDAWPKNKQKRKKGAPQK